MTRVCLQAGHQNIQGNCWPAMRPGTGANGEISWTPMMRAKVAALLRAHGVDVTEVDANVNCSGPFGPFDLFLAIHYQSNNPSPSGYGLFVPDPSVDRDNARSAALAGVIRRVYGQRTGLPDRSAAWANPNTSLYYVWQVMNGPLALIECGVGAPGAPDHDLLWGQPDLIASAIAEGVCVAFGIPFTPPAPTPAPTPQEDDDMLFVGPIKSLAATVTAFTGGFVYAAPSTSAPAVGSFPQGQTANLKGYRFSTSAVQSTDRGGGAGPGPDYVWWELDSGHWYPDADLDTTSIPGAPTGAAVSTLPPGMVSYFVNVDQPVIAPQPQPDDDTAYVTKTALKQAIGGL